jgi:CzcA family heavy metal efflux pump
MLNWIIAFCLKNRLLIIAAAFTTALYGAYLSTRMPIDVLPDVNRPTVNVMTEASALTPENIERLVTIPIEQMLNGIPGVTKVRSSSGLGTSIVSVEFEWGTDLYRNRQIVQEKLQLAREKLPPGIELQMAPITSLLGQIQMIGVTSESGKTDISELRDIADRRIRPALLSLPGVAQVTTQGGAARQLQITVDVDRLAAFDVTLDEVAEAVKAANVAVSGGTVNLAQKGLLITVSGRAALASEYARAVVRPASPRPIYVEDVAIVSFGPALVRVGDAGVNTRTGVLLMITKQPGVDTVRLTERVNAELSNAQESLPGDVKIINDIFQQSAFIHRAVDNVRDSVRDGAILVVIVLFLFLLNFRTTFITLTAIPLSVAITALVFSLFGLTINTMTLGGLAVAIGALVDDAVVDVENVFRRLRQNAASPKPRNRLGVIFRASSEVRNPILIGTLLVVIVYLPLFYLSGLEGKLFTPIGIAYIISTLASLVVSLTVTPVLCYYLLGSDKFLATHKAENRFVTKLKEIAGKAIRFSMAHPLPLLQLLLAFALTGAFVLGTRGAEFLPAFNEGTAQVNLVLPPDTSLEVSNAFGRRLEHVLKEVPGVRHVGRRTGRAEGDLHADDGVNASEVIVTFDPAVGRSRKEIVDDIRKRLAAEFPGVNSEVEQPLAHLLSAMLSGVNAQVAIKVEGPDLDVLRKVSGEIESAVRPIPGVKDLFRQSQVLMDQVEVIPNRYALANHGLTVKDLAMAAELAGGSEQVSYFNVAQITYPVVVRLGDEHRQDLHSLQNLRIRSHTGERVLLSDVADVRISKTPNGIERENVSRNMVVQHNVAGRSLSEVVRDVEQALKPIRQRLANMPGYSIRISGQFEAQAEATRLILALSVFSLMAMFVVLYLHFKSVNLALQVLLSIPMAFVGAVAYIVISGQTMSVATLVGLISLGGIAARNAILLLDHYLHLMREEKEPFSQEMIVRAGQERMAPVLMTALCSGIALVPLALGADQPGREILYPVATVIIGGLLSSTILDFLITPGIFFLFGKRDAERLASESRPHDKAAEFESDDRSDNNASDGTHNKEELVHG